MTLYSDPVSAGKINTLIFEMASLSPAVRDTLESESYRLSATSDEATTDFILTSCFNKFLNDVMTLGLHFSDIDEETLTQPSALEKFIAFVGYILPAGLYPKLKYDSTLRETLAVILEGSASNHTTAIQDYVIALGGLDGRGPIAAHLTDFLDELYPRITQTELFSDYLKNILSLYDAENLTVDHGEDRQTAYRDYIKSILGNLSDACNIFEDDPDYEAIQTLQLYVISDLISPCNFSDYAYLFLETKTELPDNLHANFDRKWFHYLVSNPVSVAYYTIRNKDITPAQQKFIACFAWVINTFTDKPSVDMSDNDAYLRIVQKEAS